MITPAKRAYIEEQAYVPEHLPSYVTAISGTEPFLFEEYLVYVGQDRLTFVGYPLSEKPDESCDACPPQGTSRRVVRLSIVKSN